jgi:hypothetical protein
MYAGPTWNTFEFTNRHKHTPLRSLIDALESRLNSREPANRSLVSLLNSLGSHLKMHFELEKPEKNFMAAAMCDTRFADEIIEQKQARETLLCDVDGMIDMARLAFTENRATGPLAERYFAFQRRFADHEAAEKKLVQDVFGANPALDA